MAVLFVNTNTMFAAANAISLSHAFTVTPGTNLVATADVAWDNTNGLSVSAITLGGTSMSALGAANQNTVSNTYTQGFWLANPPTGTIGGTPAAPTLSITMNATSTDIYVNVEASSGADQTTQPRPGSYTAPANPTTDAAGAYSLTVPSNANDITKTVVNGGSTTGSYTTNQSVDGTSFSGTDGAASDHCTTPAASVVHAWTAMGASAAISIIGYSIQAAAVIPPALPYRRPLAPQLR